MYYFDSAYVVKCYLNEPDAERVRDLVRTPVPLYSSVLCISEVACAIHRHLREHRLSRRQAGEISARFGDQVHSGVWTLVPASEGLLWDVHRIVKTLPPGVFLRASDAIHLASARLAGLPEVWTSDRHMRAAARHFGLKPRSA